MQTFLLGSTFRGKLRAKAVRAIVGIERKLSERSLAFHQARASLVLSEVITTTALAAS